MVAGRSTWMMAISAIVITVAWLVAASPTIAGVALAATSPDTTDDAVRDSIAAARAPKDEADVVLYFGQRSVPNSGTPRDHSGQIGFLAAVRPSG